MSGSPYLAWAKERAGLRYTLARSGTPPCTLEELGAGPDDLVLHSHDEDGWLPLRAAVGERYGVGGEQVALAHGCTLANHLVASLLLRPGDRVLVERPGYEPLVDLADALGAETRRFDRPGKGGGTDLAGAVAAALMPGVRLVILSDPHNPTGARVPGEAWRELAALAERSDFHVLVDEIYLDLAPGRPRTAAALSPRIVATGGLTKSFGLGALRIGWVLGAPDLVAGIIRRNDLFTVVVAHLCERLGLKALQRAEAILAPRRALLEANRARVDAFITARPELDWIRPEVGSVGWVTPTGVPLDRLEELLEREYESAIAPGRFFGVPECFRVGYGMPADDLEEALRRLGEALDRPA
jgi:aspartate/methionine/tyrosine aminotransferase